jgi:DMSO/TMAO reductase YedYZ molybdopterin-dependent catalytic subunit
MEHRETGLPPRPARRLAGAVSGLLAGAVGVATSEAVAASIDGVTSPMLAVANRAVDTTPRPVKEWAITTFGSADKAVLVGGVIGCVTVLAALIGIVGVRRPRGAVVAFLALDLVAAAAAVTDRAATAGAGPRVLPALALGIVAVGCLVLLLRPFGRTQPGAALPATVEGDDLPGSFDRRAFLRAALAVGAVATAGGLLARELGGAAAAVVGRSRLRIPAPDVPAPPVPAGATLDVPGITPHLTTNQQFYRVDTALRVPAVPVEGWTLRIHGMVDREIELTFEDLLSRRLVERRITLTCVSNEVGGDLVGNATWIGVPVRDLLAEAGVRAGADAVRSTSDDGMVIGTPLGPLTDDRDALVAVAMNGEPLPLEHGYPARMVTPGLYGYVSATKWLVDLEVTRFADFDAYWTTRGYAEEAPIKISSRIDVPGSFAQLEAGPHPVAGVAWAQGTGIERVEVRVDDGAWKPVELAEEDGIDTWRQWVWRWDAEPGSHRVEVRATDRRGYTQTPERAPVAPDGSTGWHSVNVTVF